MENYRVVEIDSILDDNNFKIMIRSNPKTAYFHQWATVLADGKEFTVGIVEDSSGRIHRVLPESIRFEQPIFKDVPVA
jgi:hypothetical protein